MLKLRNPYALHALQRKALGLKDKRAPRGGMTNEQRDYKDMAYDDDINVCNICGSNLILTICICDKEKEK